MQMQTEVTGTTMSDRVLGNLSTATLMLDESMTILFTNQATESLSHESSEHMTGWCLESGISNGCELAQPIMSQHQGMIDYSTVPGETGFTIFIPLDQRP